MTREEAKSILGDVGAYLASRASLENESLAGHSFVAICNAIKTLKQEQKTGRWISAYDGDAICGCCNRLNRLYGKYCKHCGAKMESEE